MRFVQVISGIVENRTVYAEFSLSIPVGTYRPDWERVVSEARAWCEKQFGPEKGDVWFTTGPFYFYVSDPSHAAAFKLRWC